jgi:ketosteroid isomerase-like protein
MKTLKRSLFVVLGLALAACNDGDPSIAPDTDSLVEAEEEVAAHIEVVERRLAACNEKDWDTWESLHTADARRTAPDLIEPLTTAADMRADIEELVVTFPDYHLELVEAFGLGDRLVARIHTKGTMLGPIDFNGMEVPPTGLSFEQDWVAILTFEGEKIASIDEFYDNYGTMVQLGLAP